MLRLAGALGAFIGAAGLAQAQTPPTQGQPAISEAPAAAQCLCAERVATFQARGARIEQQQGEVLISRTTGTVPATVNSNLAIGDRLVTGETGSALVSFPSGCQINLPSQSLLSIRQVDDRICAATAQAGTSFGAQASGNGYRGNVPLTGFLMATGVIVGGAVLNSVIEEGDDDNCNVVSPPC